jgi:probable phosphoglycerate mutase
MAPAPAVELVLVRHGRTSRDGTAFAGGQSDAALTAAGEDDARRVAARLTAEPIAALLVTPLRRTHATAAPLAAATGLTPAVVEDLREVMLGDLETRFATDGSGALIRAVLQEGRWDIGTGAESPAAFAARVERGLAVAAAAAGPEGGRVVAVVHGGVIAEACRAATGSAPLAFLPHLAPGSITRLRRRPDRTTIITYNDTAHLDANSAAP